MPNMSAVKWPRTSAFRRWTLLFEHSAASPLTRRQGNHPLTTSKLHICGLFLRALSRTSGKLFPNAEAHTRVRTREKMLEDFDTQGPGLRRKVQVIWERHRHGCHPSPATSPTPAPTCFSAVSQGTLFLHYHELQDVGDVEGQGHYGNPPSPPMKKSQRLLQNCPGLQVSFQS